MDEYTLIRINGRPLPAPIDQFVALVDGVESHRRLDMLWGTMTFYSDRTVQQLGEARRVVDGIPGDSILPGRLDGSYRRSETEIVITFRHPLGYVDSLRYFIGQGGDILVGEQDPGRVHEYTRN